MSQVTDKLLDITEGLYITNNKNLVKTHAKSVFTYIFFLTIGLGIVDLVLLQLGGEPGILLIFIVNLFGAYLAIHKLFTEIDSLVTKRLKQYHNSVINSIKTDKESS